MGNRLTGAVDATFVSSNCFTGDGAVRSAAFSNGPRGWGVIQGGGLHHIASYGGNQRPAHWPPDAVRWGITFSRGYLETINGSNGFLGDAGAGVFPLVEYWRWTGTGYEGVSNNEFNALRASRPRYAASLPRQCPSDGTFRADIGVIVEWEHARRPDPPLQLYVFRPNSHEHVSSVCRWRIWPNFPVTVLGGNQNGGSSRWMTAPSWMFAASHSGGGRVRWFNRDGDTAPGYAAFAVPHQWHLNVILSALGHARLPSSFTGSGELSHRLARGTVTIRGGLVEGISVNPARTDDEPATSSSAGSSCRHWMLADEC